MATKDSDSTKERRSSSRKKKTKDTEFAVNVMEHVLVPKAELLSEDQKKKVLVKYNISESQFPKISKSDPVAKALVAEVGTLIKINREDPTANYTSYRIVVG